MSSELPKKFVAAAIIVAILAAVLLGMAIESTMKPSQTTTVANSKYADITLMVQGDLTLGPDNNTHDSFVPCNFTVYTSQTVNLTIYNYDSMPHSFTSTTLNVNFQIPASTTTGVSTVSHFQFNETTPGSYRWWCAIPCDNDAGGWAMTTGSDGQPDQIGYMGGFVSVLQG